MELLKKKEKKKTKLMELHNLTILFGPKQMAH